MVALYIKKSAFQKKSSKYVCKYLSTLMYSVPVRKSKRREKKYFVTDSFHGNFSIYQVKKCHYAETIRQFLHFLLSKKNSFRGQNLLKLIVSSLD